MKKRSKIIIAVLTINEIILGIGTVLLYFSKIKEYSYLTLTIFIIGIIIFVTYLNSTKDENSYFKSKLKRILNTYDSILVQTDKLPNLQDKDIIKVNKFEDLINTQGETKKPIFYIVDKFSAVFVLIDNNLVCYLVLKVNNEIIDQFEQKIEELELKKNNIDIEESMLKDIENTTIIKLPNIGSYKVSPIRKKEMVEDSPNEIQQINVENLLQEEAENINEENVENIYEITKSEIIIIEG